MLVLVTNKFKLALGSFSRVSLCHYYFSKAHLYSLFLGRGYKLLRHLCFE